MVQTQVTWPQGMDVEAIGAYGNSMASIQTEAPAGYLNSEGQRVIDRFWATQEDAQNWIAYVQTQGCVSAIIIT